MRNDEFISMDGAILTVYKRKDDEPDRASAMTLPLNWLRSRFAERVNRSVAMMIPVGRKRFGGRKCADWENAISSTNIRMLGVLILLA